MNDDNDTCTECACPPGERECWDAGDGVWYEARSCGCDCHEDRVDYGE
jgi:hypothetical protein